MIALSLVLLVCTFDKVNAERGTAQTENVAIFWCL